MMNGHLTFDWRLPDGFVAFSPDDCSDAWLEHFVAGHGGVDAAAARSLEARTRKAVLRCRAQAEQPDGWALIVLDAGGVPRMAGVAEVTIGPWIDPASRLETWRAELGRRGASPGESRLLESAHSSAALLRTVELVSEGERDVYVERGVIAASWPQLGVTGVLRITAATLLVFDDLMEFLEETARDFSVEPRRSSAPHRRATG